MVNSPSVFIVDDDKGVLDAISALLSSAGYVVECFHSSDEFLKQASGDFHSPVVCDHNMPGMTGIELCVELKRLGRGNPFILITAFVTETIKLDAERAGVRAVLAKPCDPASLLETVGSASG